jgi:hypothetical protein
MKNEGSRRKKKDIEKISPTFFLPCFQKRKEKVVSEKREATF